MDSDFYTAEEAMQRLGMAKTTFYEEVNAGNIPSVIEKNRKRGRKFPKAAIEVHVKMLQQANQVHRTFDKATNADLWTAIEYDRELYGDDDIIHYKRALEWKQRNSDIFMMMKDGEELSGTVTFIPLDEDTIHSLINDKIRERNIPDWAIRKWTDPELSVYVPTISIFPTGNKTADTERGRSLICYTLRWALTLHRQYEIKNWYAIAATEDGEKLLKGLGFKKISGTREGYIMDDIETIIPSVKKLFKRLEEEDNWSIPVPVVDNNVKSKRGRKKRVPGSSPSVEA
jgi:predicted DNA-binding transcriptional regulator AlpA